MRSHNDGGAIFVDIVHDFEDLLGGDGVEAAGGLVGENHLRLIDEGAGDADALLLTTRQLVRILEILGLQMYQLQHFLHTGFHRFLVLPTGSLHCKYQIFFNRFITKKLIILKNNTQLATQLRNMLGLEVLQVKTDTFRLLAHGRHIGKKHLQDGGLSATGFSNQIDEFSFVDGDVDFGKNQYFLLKNIHIFQDDNRFLNRFLYWLRYLRCFYWLGDGFFFHKRGC